MIIKKSVLAKLYSINCSDMELFTDTIKRFNPHKCRCPICGAKGQCKRIGSYPRMMITIKDGKRCLSVLRITRVKCLSCQHTHAVLPDILVPFGSYTITFILSVLKAYLLRESTVAEICTYYQIAASTLYSWIHLFTSRYNAWVPILQRINVISSFAIDYVMSVEAFPSVFFRRFRFHFLQARTTHCHPLHFPSPGTPGDIT